jgi:hypothetical protein
MTQAVHVCLHWIRLYMYACTDRLCHPRASPPPTEKKPETHKQTNPGTNTNNSAATLHYKATTIVHIHYISACLLVCQDCVSP